MKQTLYRLFCLLLCAVMVVGMIPATASAAQNADKQPVQYEEQIVEEPVEGYMVERSENGITTHIPTTFNVQKKISVPATQEAQPKNSFAAGNAIVEDAWDSNIYFDNFEDLKELCSRTYTNWAYFVYQGSDDLVISEDLTIPAYASLFCHNSNSAIIVSKGVTLSIARDGSLSCYNLKVNGKLNAEDGIHVEHSLIVNGSLTAGNVSLALGAELTGVDKITVTRSEYKLQYNASVHNLEDFKSIVATAKKDPQNFYSIDFYAEPDSIISSSMTIPKNTHLWLYCWDGTVTLGSGVTLTLEGDSYINCKMVVKGKLVNKGRLDFGGESLKFTSTGSYSGSGYLFLFAEKDSNISNYTDVITGLKTDNLDIVKNVYDWSTQWEIRDISSLTRLSAPSKLTWNKALEWDYEAQEEKAVTRYGAIRFAPGKVVDKSSDHTLFDLVLYRNGKEVFRTCYGYDNNHLQNTDYVYANFAEDYDFLSGEYYFTVQARSESPEYYNSPIVKSKTWTYTRPSTKMSKPTGLKWDGLRATWTPYTSKHTAHAIEFYYSPTANGEKEFIGKSFGDYLTDTNVSPWQINEHGYGYYFFRVRTLSTNITKKAHSSWSSMSKGFHYTKNYTPSTPKLQVYSDQSGKPFLEWIASPGATKYQIYRATSKTGTYKHLKTVSFEYDPYYCSYIDSSASIGKTYYYKVRAISANDIKSSFSNVKSQKVRLSWPQNVTIATDASTGKPVVKWGAVSGAVKYEVWRATSMSGNYKKVKTTTSRSFTDTTASAGKVYYYYVIAVHKSTAYNSYGSDLAYIRCALKRPNVSIQLTSGGDPYLKWSEISGAAKYYIYRSTSKTGTYERIGSTSSEKYIDKTAKAGKTYYYKVKAIHSNSAANSAYSAIDSIKAK